MPASCSGLGRDVHRVGRVEAPAAARPVRVVDRGDAELGMVEQVVERLQRVEHRDDLAGRDADELGARRDAGVAAARTPRRRRPRARHVRAVAARRVGRARGRALDVVAERVVGRDAVGADDLDVAHDALAQIGVQAVGAGVDDRDGLAAAVEARGVGRVAALLRRRRRACRTRAGGTAGARWRAWRRRRGACRAGRAARCRRSPRRTAGA